MVLQKLLDSWLRLTWGSPNAIYSYHLGLVDNPTIYGIGLIGLAT